MAQGINKAILIGNLGADPETRYTASGTAVTNCSIATSETWKDKNTGEKQEKTEWHRIVFFARLAEVAGEYLRKGSKVYVEGRIQTRKWQGQDGQDRYTTEIVANQMQMLDSRGAGHGGGQAKAEQQASAHRATTAADYGAASRGGTPPSGARPTQAPAGPDDAYDDLDDVPF